MTADDKKNYIQSIENALTYHSELVQKQATADKRKDAPVLGETIYRYTNKLEDVISYYN